jgi:hypothetical protein
MNLVLNALSWLFLMAVLVGGSYLLFFELGTMLTDPASTARAAVRPLAIVLSLVLTPAVLGVAMLIFRGRQA